MSITSNESLNKVCGDALYNYMLAHLHVLNTGATHPAFHGNAPAQAGKPPRTFETFESNDAARKLKLSRPPAAAAAAAAAVAPADVAPTVAKPFTITSGARLTLAAIVAAVANLCEKSTLVSPTFAALAAQPLPEAAFLGVFVRAAEAMRGHLAVDPLQRDQGMPAAFMAKINTFTSVAAHPAVETLSRCLTDFFKCIACRAAELAFDCGTAAAPRAWTLNDKTLRGIFRSLAVAGTDATAANAAMSAFIDYVKEHASAAEATRAAARTAARAARTAAVGGAVGGAASGAASAASDESNGE